MGTTFTSQAVQQEARPEEMRPAGHGEIILVVDDEPFIRDLGQKTLSRYGDLHIGA